MSEFSDWQYRTAADVDLSPLDRMRSVRREPGLVSRTSHAFCLRLLRGYFRLYHRWRIIGAENLPRDPPFVMIANHASHLDALLLAAALPHHARRCTFPVAAGDVFFTSPRRSVASAMFLNALPLWRRKTVTHALADLRTRLSLSAPMSCGLILFPEGARSRDGAIMPFKSGLGMLVAESRVPVVPCRISGAFAALRPGHCFPLPAQLTLRIGPPLDFSNVSNNREGWTHIAARAEAAVRSMQPA